PQRPKPFSHGRSIAALEVLRHPKAFFRRTQFRFEIAALTPERNPTLRKEREAWGTLFPRSGTKRWATRRNHRPPVVLVRLTSVECVRFGFESRTAMGKRRMR